MSTPRVLYRTSAPVYSFGTQVSSGTTASALVSLLYLWHPANNTKRIEIFRVTASVGAGSTTAANKEYLLKLGFITAENGTPGAQHRQQ